LKELAALKDLARRLEEKGYTLNISSSGKPLLKMGKGANPGLLSVLGPIEVKDLKGILMFLKE
jgi:hypothetical protein